MMVPELRSPPMPPLVSTASDCQQKAGSISNPKTLRHSTRSTEQSLRYGEGPSPRGPSSDATVNLNRSTMHTMYVKNSNRIDDQIGFSASNPTSYPHLLRRCQSVLHYDFVPRIEPLFFLPAKSTIGIRSAYRRPSCVYQLDVVLD